MSMIRIEKKEEWIYPLDCEIVNEKMHLQQLAGVLEILP